MRNGRIWLVGVVVLFAGFWIVRGLFGGPDGSPNDSRDEPSRTPPVAEQLDAPEMDIELVEPPSEAGTISPTGLLRRMYPSLWRANGFCWEEVEAAHDGDSPRVETGLAHGDEPPPDLLEFFEGRGERLDEYEHQWFNRHQLLFMRQEMVVTEGGRSGPSAAVRRVVRREAPDGRQFWERYDSAAVYPCD